MIDRAGLVGLANDRIYKNKVGAVVSAFRRTGGMHTIETMNHFLFANEIIVAGRALGMARDRGDMEKDDEGIQMAKRLGQRMAWIMKKLRG